MKMMHTKGPWKFRPTHNDPDFLGEIEGPNKEAIGVVYFARKEAEGDARIMSAAWDMYEALKLAKKMLQTTHLSHFNVPDLYDQINAALTKAEGGI